MSLNRSLHLLREKAGVAEHRLPLTVFALLAIAAARTRCWPTSLSLPTRTLRVFPKDLLPRQSVPACVVAQGSSIHGAGLGTSSCWISQGFCRPVPPACLGPSELHPYTPVNQQVPQFVVIYKPKMHAISTRTQVDGLYITLPVHDTTIRSTWLQREPSPGSDPAGVATCILSLCFPYVFDLGACSVFHPKSSFTVEYGCTPTCFCHICFVPGVFTLMFSPRDIFCHMSWSESCASSVQVPVGARGTLPLHVHARGEAHTLDVSETAAHRDTGGSRDPYRWKRNAKWSPLQDPPLWPGWAW